MSNVLIFLFAFLLRVFLHLAGIENIDEIGQQSEEIMDQVDSNQDGSISRQEWREKWNTVQALRQFRDKVTDNTLKAEMVAKYGKAGPQHIPLYAFGNKMNFFGLDPYPTLPEDRPEGILHIPHIHFKCTF